MDTLADLLSVVKLSGAVFLEMSLERECAYLTAPARRIADFLMPEAEHVIPYHFVTEGRCRAGLAGSPPVELAAGDLVVFPGGDRHVIGTKDPEELSRCHVEIPPESLGAMLERGALRSLAHEGQASEARIVCGFLACETRVAGLFLSTLPRVVHVSLRDERALAWMRSSISYAADRSAAVGGRSATAVSKLAELLFSEAIRHYMESGSPGPATSLAALCDRHVGRALALLHGEPEHAWTVRELARRVGLSRSALGERFNALVGVPPIQYLTRWRTSLAAARLRNTDQSVVRVALDVGYESEAAFNRAFKREYGLPPATWRRRGLRAALATDD